MLVGVVLVYTFVTYLSFVVLNLIGILFTFLIIRVISIIIDWLIVKRVINDPAKSGMVSVFLAFAIVLIWTLYDMASGRQEVTWQSWLFLFGGLVVVLVVQWPIYKRAKRKYEMQDAADDLS